MLISSLQNTEKNLNFASPLKIQRLKSFQLQGPLDRAAPLPKPQLPRIRVLLDPPLFNTFRGLWSYVNISCNERADTAAKAALCLPVTSKKLPAYEFKPCTSRFCLEEWQDIWNSAANNKLHAICPTVGKCVHNNLVSHRDAVIVNRLKIGHSRFTHSYLLSGEDQPKCDTALTVKHILLD